MKLFRSKKHLGFWIAEDAHGSMMMWPARPRGWTARTGFGGSKQGLEECDPSMARGTGWPFGPTGRKPKRGAPSKGLTIRVTDAERATWEDVAGGKGKLSDWVREVCNTAAAAAKRSKGKP